MSRGFSSYPLWKLLVGGGVSALLAAAVGPSLRTSVGQWRAERLQAVAPAPFQEEFSPASGAEYELPEGAEAVAAFSRPVSMALHLHGAVSEGDAGWQWHSQQAITNNIDVAWWSDHDGFYYPDGTPSADGYDFESGSLSDTVTGWPSDTTVALAWALSDEDNPLASGSFAASTDAARTGAYGGRVSGRATVEGVEERGTWYLGINPRFQYKALLGQLDLSFAVRPVATDPDGELQVVVPLNATRGGATNPDDDDHRSIVFYHGGSGHPSMSDDGLTHYVPIDATEGAWTDVSADLTALAVAAWGESEAHDLHGEMITVRVVASSAATVTYDVDDFAWAITHRAEELMDLQSNYLAELGSDPVHFVGVEVSHIDPGHFNVYGDMPFLPYATDDTLDPVALSDWAHSAGALVSYNHMFGVGRDRDSAATRAEKVATQIDQLIAEAAWDIDILEIGYRVRGGIMADFLEVWDAVSMAGLYLTGIGAMDQHNEVEYATLDNNFVTYVNLSAITEEAAKTELSRGNAWFGDPTFFTDGHFTMSISSPAVVGLRMGSVVVGRVDPLSLRLVISEVPSATKINLVENGVITQSWINATARRWQRTVTVDPTGGNVVRLEVLSNPGGNPIAYSNPVYFAPSGATGVPANRRVVAR